MSMETNKLVVTHDAGFFSCCTIRLQSIIRFFNETGVLPLVDSSKQWSNYKDDKEYSDITDKLFKTKDTTIEKKEIVFNFDGKEDQFGDYDLINYEDLKFFIDKYFSPTDDVVERKNYYINKYDIDIDETISVLYRGNDKGSEIHLPSFQSYLTKVNDVVKQYPQKKILIQTDENEFCDFMLSNFPDAIVVKELKRINRSHTAIQFVTPIGEKFNLAFNFLSVLFLISQTSIVLTNKGNVGLWCCLYRGDTNNVFII